MHPLQPTGDAARDVELLREWLGREDEQRLVIETSGSTGRPKRVLLSRSAVLASVRASAARIGTGRWVLALPSSYVAGVQVICRSLVAGHDPALSLDELAPGDCVSLVPTQLHRALADGDLTAGLAQAHVALLGGGPIDPDLRRRAEQAGVPVVATYGASETAGGCVYDGYPLDGVGVVVGSDGRVRLGGPTVFDGYEDDPDLTAQALVDGWYLTSDAGRLDEDGRLQVLGRLDDVVVSGGVKVPLPAVAATLRAHPGVEAAECVGLLDDEWGTRVVAVVVPSRVISPAAGTTAPSLDSLRDHVAAAHPRAWAPRAVVVVEAIPLLAHGKVDRRALEELASGATG